MLSVSEMTRLWGKFPTIDSALSSHSLGGIEHPLVNRLIDFKTMYKQIRSEKVNWTYVKKLDGTIWNIIDSLKEIWKKVLTNTFPHDINNIVVWWYELKTELDLGAVPNASTISPFGL